MTWLGGERAIARALVALAAAGFLGCGRTQLNDVDPCDPAVDTTRPCGGFCGPGTESCVDYAWQACVIPVVTRACSNDCGPGIETCDGEQWQGCEVAPVTRSCSSVCGSGNQTCTDGVWAACDAPRAQSADPHDDGARLSCAQPARLRAGRHRGRQQSGLTSRDPDLGIVESTLGSDGTPVYAGNPTTPTTTGAADFNEWYHDVPGVNLRTMISLPLMASADRARLLRLRQPVLLPDRQPAVRQRRQSAQLSLHARGAHPVPVPRRRGLLVPR